MGTEELCEKYSMVPRHRPAKIYDAFLFNDELDMLEVPSVSCHTQKSCMGAALTVVSPQLAVCHHDRVRTQ